MKNYQESIAWSIDELKGISPSICMHKILLEENAKPSVEYQRRLNPVMKEVVRKEVLKWLNAGFIYAISDSPWVNPVHVVPKKGGFTMNRNEKNELIPTRTVTGWRVCIDYRKLNTATRKDHFPLPFIDQMLDRLAGHPHFCFLDGYSGYNKICHAPDPGPTRLANPNRFRGAKPYTGTPHYIYIYIYFFFSELTLSVVYK